MFLKVLCLIRTALQRYVIFFSVSGLSGVDNANSGVRPVPKKWLRNRQESTLDSHNFT